ncbi:MAG: Re/Si-specific NAD(P)(+) transhydrogenase subunit alpha [Solirubrobacterales bacterium]|nr:Re/Si-specific NAD(P)(+) transhydrogenase subunit alpha [Solirubrobacterales bacterium]
MKIAVPKETQTGEQRVALVPEVVGRLTAAGHVVVVEAGAGAGAMLPDSAFTDAGATIVADASGTLDADVIARVAPPSAEETAALRKESVVIGFLQPLSNGAGISALANAGVSAFALESVPRISRAQSMDALSSQSNVAGYRAALIGAQELGRFYPMLMTAAGTIRPATVLVLGAGVAGLQAIATARRLGAVVQAFDVRAAVKEQVESLGAVFLEFDLGGDLEGEGGYAKELTEEQRARQQELLAEAIGKVDVVITTALVPGRPAPKLVTTAAVEAMKPGSVVVDLAGEAGGNCELTQPGETVIHSGVKIVSPLNIPSTMAEHASQLYAKNIQSLLELMTNDDGGLELDFEDEIIAGACITKGGEIVNEAARAAASGQGA